MAKVKKRRSISRRIRAEAQYELVLGAYFDSEWDEELHRLMFGIAKCLKCGSEVFEEALDIDNGITWCCSDCPEYDRHA
jgi:hypothetical protein